MAGTNKKKKLSFSEPVIILNKPQLAENIGMVARTMVNFGLKNLRLVNPKANWTSKKSFSASAGAFEIIKKYTFVYDNLSSAIEDLHFLCATTVRKRDLDSRYCSPKTAVKNIINNYNKKKIGFLFGGEKAGLNNNDISEANLLITIPTNKAFGSLNLAMAVNIIGYEWYINQKDKSKKVIYRNSASKKEINFFKERVIRELYNTNFFESLPLDSRLVINVKNIISKITLSDKELKILHGIISSLKNFKINN